MPATDSHTDSGTKTATSAGTAAVVVLAVLAAGTAVTVLGPVLQPFLVALFLFHATQFGAKSLAGLGMRPWAAYTALIGLALIFSTLTAQFVYREAEVFQRTWPRYEDRVATYLTAWVPSFAVATPTAPTAGDVTPPQATTPAAGAGRQSSATVTSQRSGESATATTADEQAPLPEQTADLLGPSATPPPEPSETGDEATRRSREGGERFGRTSLTDLFRITSQDVLKYVFSHSLDVAELIVVVFCYLVFLFVGSRKLEARVLRAFPGERGERLAAIGAGITESMERFMVVKTATGVGMAVSAAALMYAFGLDHWMLWAFLFFAANYITYIGSIAACIPPILMAYLDLDNAALATLLSALLVLNRVLWIDFFELRMSGRELNLDPTLLFLWLSYWGWAWGILGLILAYPMLAAVRITLEHLGGLHGWALLLSDE